MKKVFKLSFIFILFITVISLTTGCSKNYLKEITYKQYKDLIEKKETFVVEVMRTSCSACQDFKPKLEEFANKYKVEVKYINTDNLSKEDADKVYDELGVSGTPSIIFINEGVEKTKSSRIVGSVSVDKIASKFKANGFLKEE